MDSGDDESVLWAWDRARKDDEHVECAGVFVSFQRDTDTQACKITQGTRQD